MQNKLGVHESLELQELLSFKSLCLTKASLMRGLVSDDHLKAIMQQDADMHVRHLQALRDNLTEGEVSSE
ncbi:hypothetical protein [Virgibacillus sediminis]|uniref:Spore coat protein n=1 Tax=Virgibacillus sediminis TaxID=202260 RepID=A0ABV7AAS9_9BACI